MRGGLSRCRFEEGTKIARVTDFLDAMASCPTPTFVMDKHDLAEEFFDLKSGLAGEFLQKVSNYRKRLAILGDYSAIAGKALRDFIYESNRTGQVVFAEDLEGAIDLLKP